MLLLKEDLWNVNHLEDLGEEGDFGEEGMEEELGWDWESFKWGASLHSTAKAREKSLSRELL